MSDDDRLRWFRQDSGVWHLTFDRKVAVCGHQFRMFEGMEPETVWLGDGPPKSTCVACREEMRVRLGLPTPSDAGEEADDLSLPGSDPP